MFSRFASGSSRLRTNSIDRPTGTIATNRHSRERKECSHERRYSIRCCYHIRCRGPCDRPDDLVAGGHERWTSGRDHDWHNHPTQTKTPTAAPTPPTNDARASSTRLTKGPDTKEH